MKKILSITGTILITFITFIFLSSCTLLKKLPEIDNSEVETIEDSTSILTEEDGQPGQPDNNNTDISQQVLYLEIGISEDSMHFEHRVTSIYSVDPDRSEKRLIYTDINEKYDLGRVYNVSPDGSSILCGFFEGGRGAYTSLSLIDIKTGGLMHLIEFDYTDDPDAVEFKHVINDPVWSKNGERVVYIVASSQESTGDLYIISSDGTGNRQLTDYGSGVSRPIFSPDGMYIAFLFYTYNEDKTILEDTSIKIINIETGNIYDSASGYLVDFIDWIEIDNLLK
jgi:Tol biopolymer transport system component